MALYNPSPAMRRIIARQYKEGKTIKELSRDHHIPEVQMKRILKEEGVYNVRRIERFYMD